jgi:hypothetical protein
MSRIRSIKPAFWADEDMASDLTRDQRLLYIGLWNLCFDNWAMEYKPRSIKRELFGFDDDVTPDVVDEWIHQIAATGRVVFFEHNGQACIWLPKCADHQQVNRPQPSPLPLPDGTIKSVTESVHGTLTEHSLLDRIGKDRIGGGTREDTPPPGDIAKVGSEFEKRTGKTAGSALVSLCADHPTDILLEAIKRAAESGKTSPAYIRAVAEGLTADGWKASAKKPRGEPKWKADAEKAAQSQRTYDKPPVVCAICGDTGATLATGDACECSAGDAWRT